ncbi:CoA transferase subunit A [Bacillus aquiflavi]|uniref:CoA transferase subunit A n=1 Tax=Bacillus aquiflavi TaxID=2672567 RepID=A0A6B3VXK4_9BACI|nr:CoA transferase subunit A [Bacillus aquiflavi]MBA4537762.1 CoA transferase subunit A [Bacillus aquiflavi]NEY82018.1 CoA transferase subunit A [Bacillus aquiflavi]UAC46946.1 CoA transferase subunit A [Bacillus aquiflavi]
MENSFGKITKLAKVIDHFYDGMSLMVGGFGGIGNPPTIIKGILKKGIKNITLICNDTGFPHIGVGKMVREGRVKKVIASHIGSNPVAGELMTKGILEVEFSPQGTLAERIRAGGLGLGGILTDIGIDNDLVSKGKGRVTVNGKQFLLETPLTADVSIVYAKKADPFGNLIFDKSARNTNPLVAMAGNITIAEVEEFVELGELDPEEIVTPGVFVDYMIRSDGVNWKWAWE